MPEDYLGVAKRIVHFKQQHLRISLFEYLSLCCPAMASHLFDILRYHGQF